MAGAVFAELANFFFFQNPEGFAWENGTVKIQQQRLFVNLKFSYLFIAKCIV